MGKTTRTDRECTNHGFIRGAHARQPVVHRSGSLGHGFIRGTQVSRDMNKPRISPWYEKDKPCDLVARLMMSIIIKIMD